LVAIVALSASASAAPVVSFKAPYISGTVVSGHGLKQVSGCGSSLTVTHPKSMSLTSGYARVTANATVAACGGNSSWSEAIYSGIEGVSENFTPSASGTYNVSGTWLVRGFASLGANDRPNRGYTVAAAGALLLKVRIIDPSTGTLIAYHRLNIWPNTGLTNGYSSVAWGNSSGPAKYVVSASANLSAGHTYELLGFIRFVVVATAPFGTLVGQWASASLTLAPGVYGARLASLSVT